MTKGWIVNQVSWGYNDEYYYTEEGNPGHPVKVFGEKTDALVYANKLEAQSMRRVGDLSEYRHGEGATIELAIEINELISNPLHKLQINEFEGVHHWPSIILHAEIPDNELIKIANHLNLCWFTVTKIEVEE